MNVLQITSTLTDEAAGKLSGKLLDETSYDTLITEDTDVLKPDGSFLVRYRKNVLPVAYVAAAAKNLRDAARPTKTRAIAAGDPEPRANEVRVGMKVQRILKDGTLSSTLEAKQVLSGIVGAFTPTPRNPYCRLTAFTLDNPEKVAAGLPLVKACSEQFRQLMPERWEAQRQHIARTSPDFKIADTVFTTFSVNKDWQTAVHKDAGDLRAGFGVMTVLRSGMFEGCYLVFPQFRIAVDMRNRCICLADVHEWHGNTPFIGKAGTYERMSLVMYYREKMDRCGSAADQLERVKSRKKGDALI